MMNTLIIISGLVLIYAHYRDHKGIGRINYFGGNSGYINYSMSVRAKQARDNGKYPKTDFCKEYSLTQAAFLLLSKIGGYYSPLIINGDEWHHTSKYGNRTTFYQWVDDFGADWYIENKKVIDSLAKEYKRLSNTPYPIKEDMLPEFETSRRKIRDIESYIEDMYIKQSEKFVE